MSLSVRRLSTSEPGFADDLTRHLKEKVGEACEQRYWDIFEACRREVGYADYLGALQRFRTENPREPRLLGISLYLLHYPFASRLFPRALDVIRGLKARGRVAILSDGDVVAKDLVKVA